MNNILEIKKLNKTYKDFKLKNINISIPYGKIVGLIGENGSGKTTTIKAIINSIKIDSGSIKIFNKEYKELTKIDKESIGVVLDDSFLSDHYKIDEIDSIMSKLYSNWDSNYYYKYINKFKLPKDKIIKEFSNGMKMKIKLLCALSHKPKLLILDEPTNGLDPVARYEILNMFENFINKENGSIFISSHITSDLDYIADEIIFINDGKILLDMNKKELFDKYRIVYIEPNKFDKDKYNYNRYLKYKDVYMLLIKKEDISSYKKSEIKTPTIEELMLMLIKGVKR